MKKWPLKYRFWRIVHVFFNRLAWRFMPTKDYKDPRNKHWLWKLNAWAGNHYTLWWATEGRKIRRK